MPFEIVRNDITKMRTDAIVNAANPALTPGGGVCGAIFKAAGFEKLEAACRGIGRCETGGAVITPGFELQAKYIIHAVGPVWQGGSKNEPELLKSCYRSALELAQRHRVRSIAFPLISSGIFGYPKAEALKTAVSAISEFLLEHDMSVYLVVYERGAVVLSEKLLGRIRSYIDEHYVETHNVPRPRAEMEILSQFANHTGALPDLAEHFARPAAAPQSAAAKLKKRRSLDDAVKNLGESFSHMLLRLIDEKGMTDVEFYKRANIDRKLFSKIRKGGAYNPSKSTAVACAVALRLSLDETLDLISKAGYTLSHSSLADVIVEYFIESGVSDIYEINEALFAFGQRLLGAQGA